MDNKHLSRSALEEYLALSGPATIVVPGNPTCRIVIDAPRRLMALRTPHRGNELDLADFVHVDARLIFVDGATWCEVSIDYRNHAHEAYLLLCDIVDMVQQNGMTLAAAVLLALSTFEDLLARAAGLTAERRTGLYGELLFLEACIRSVPAAKAIASWKGFAAHEHDFVFPRAGFEIKTTRTEKRRHRIGSLEQLQPLPTVPLWLVSVQLTEAAPGGGRSLPELVDDVRAAVGSTRRDLDTALARAGWRERDRSLYRDTLTLRTVPAAYPVDESFPMLTRGIVSRSCVRPELIIDASYTIDVTSLPSARPPAPADRFIEESC
ncbi:PD-(D/E)XK motif protein [Amycolatopsis sp. WAC 04169]|uniref:PD-(D/E)XK motif protein n=1 Tax=Amycolatopsis sp. WAC 04169 TaxID=2203197 RepID=UPI001315320E|nr:PD-(D/E)XK motif protein [Amycolatopsis sp. WAC 04169]